MSDEKRILCKEPWPKYSIENYTEVDSGPWGYLICYSDSTFVFVDDETPTRQEILSLWLPKLQNEKDTDPKLAIAEVWERKINEID